MTRLMQILDDWEKNEAMDGGQWKHRHDLLIAALKQALLEIHLVHHGERCDSVDLIEEIVQGQTIGRRCEYS